MSSFKGIAAIFFFVLFVAGPLISCLFKFLCGYRNTAKENDTCHHCEKGKFEIMPDVDFDSYPSMGVILSKEELMCTHCGTRDTGFNKW